MSILFKKVKNDVKNIAADIKEATRTNTAGNDEDSPELSIASFTVSPHKVRKGGQVTVKVRYIVRGARKDGLTITESKHLLYNNQTTASLDSKKVKRENGTWESTTSFKVPRSAKTGKYKIKQSIIVDDGTNLQSLGYFTVTQ